MCILSNYLVFVQQKLCPQSTYTRTQTWEQQKEEKQTTPNQMDNTSLKYLLSFILKYYWNSVVNECVDDDSRLLCIYSISDTRCVFFFISLLFDNSSYSKITAPHKVKYHSLELRIANVLRLDYHINLDISTFKTQISGMYHCFKFSNGDFIVVHILLDDATKWPVGIQRNQLLLSIYWTKLISSGCRISVTLFVVPYHVSPL